MLENKKYRPLIFSILLHVLLLLITYFGLPDISNRETEELVISLESFPVSEVSNVKQQEEKKESLEKEEIKSDREVPQSHKNEQKLEKLNEKEEKSMATPQPKEEKQAEQKEEKPKNNEVKDSDKSQPEEEKQLKSEDRPKDKEPNIIKEETKEKSKTQEKLKESIKEKPKADKSKQNDLNELDSLLKTLEAPREKNTDEAVKNDKDAKSFEQKGQKKSQGKYGDNLPLSLSERDSIGNQIYNSWYFQAGAKDSKEMYVLLKISVNIDGTVGRIEITDINKYNKSSNAYRVFVDSAIRAVKKASPFKGLSQERYEAWRELELNFDPRGVIF